MRAADLRPCIQDALGHANIHAPDSPIALTVCTNGLHRMRANQKTCVPVVRGASAPAQMLNDIVCCWTMSVKTQAHASHIMYLAGTAAAELPKLTPGLGFMAVDEHMHALQPQHTFPCP